MNYVMENCLVKIGGSILENQNAISSTILQLDKLLHKGKRCKNFIIITGGGSFANFVRYIDNKLNIGNDLAHWEAILSMDLNAEGLHKQFPSTSICDNFSGLTKKMNENSSKHHLLIFKTFNYLYKKDILPHSWNITSDSIALHIAFQLGLKKCYLIKDVDGIINVKGDIIKELSVDEFRMLKESKKLAEVDSNAENLKEQSIPIDSYSLKLIDEYGIPCVILNGSPSKQRILQYFTNNQTLYTSLNPTK